ncbi:MAG TPA: hypothetical protein VNR37_04020 [Microbacteriaceae bacterium]|nr:hypothetical protein [Microbacteriaceae bacterium]
MRRSTVPLSDFQIAATEIGAAPEALASLPADEWISAIVPGGVHESLLAAGRIPHPYRNENESEMRWVEERDWWYRTTFAAPDGYQDGKRLVLRFLGLDTVADIWLNGAPLGHHENMFRPAEFDVKAVVRDENELLIRFAPPLSGLQVPPLTDTWQRLSRFMPTDPDGMQLAAQRRKAPFSWGWDFSPRLPSIGIWRPVELEIQPEAVIGGHHIWTDRIDADGTAHLGLLVEVDRPVTCRGLTLTVRITTPSGETLELGRAVDDGIGRSRVELECSLPAAALWWTHDLGTPALHAIELGVADARGVLDQVEDRFGVRTIELDRSADPEGGRLFRFVLNGVPIFARGASWVPADTMVGSVDAERYRSLVDLAVDGGMNMLRIWGGGVYEHDAFYSTCDERGVLIWHDFMFANAEYPDNSTQLKLEVRAEAEYQVRRLRNRPSLALWNANNEEQLFHAMGYHDLEPGNWGWEIFFRILPDAVAAEDGRTPYWPGSPWGEAEEEGVMAAGGVLDGDRHAWEVWHGLDFGAGGTDDYATVGEARHYRRYARDRGKFISEFGVLALPELATLRRWIDDDRLAVHSPTFDAHNKDHPKDKAEPVLELITGVPTTVEEYVDFSMVYQAEGLKFGIEHYRHRQPHNNGTLIWQLNDSWPGFSWSVVDYDGVQKAGFYYAKRAFQPVIALFTHAEDRLELWLCNSTAEEQAVSAEVSLEDFSGSARLREPVSARIPAGSAVLAWSTSFEADAAVVAWVRSADGHFPDNRLFFAEIKDLPFGPAELETTIEAHGDGRATVTLASSSLVYLARVLSPAPATRFSDNYVDVVPGRPTRIEVSGLPDGFDAAHLRIQSYIGSRPRR